jgi:hypothetical protein
VYQLENNTPVYNSIVLSVKSEEKKQMPNMTLASPSHYSETSPYFPTIFKFLYRLLGIEAQKAVDYLEISNKIIISYYIYREKSFQNYLLVTNRDREILLNDLIAETEGLGIDTFTVKSDTLLYVKNETQFIGYEL